MTRGRIGGALLGALGLALSSCAGLLGVDDYKSSTEELCDLLSSCYDLGRAECEAHVGGRLDGASAADRSAWLNGFSDFQCPDRCTSARKCLDLDPVCQTVSCARDTDCCGFLKGKAGCNTQLGTCCRKDGVGCDQNDHCCSGACDAQTRTCGGVVCREYGAICKNDFECCSKACVDDHCSETVCVQLDEACDATTPCCDGECIEGRCTFGTCRHEGEPCLTLDDCCVEDGTACLPLPGGDPQASFCQQPTCLPDGVDCMLNQDCCSTFCDPNFGKCGTRCGGPGAGCVDGNECCSGSCGGATFGQCDCSDLGCVDGTDCCSGSCVGGACAPACTPGTVCHDECEPGPALAKTCIDPVTSIACAAKVCAKDEYCCCVEWDDVCVDLAIDAENCTVAVCGQ